MNYLEKARAARKETAKRIEEGSLIPPKTLEELYIVGAKEGWSDKFIESYRKSRFPTQADLDAIVTV
jgi:hypothetical protein